MDFFNISTSTIFHTSTLQPFPLYQSCVPGCLPGCLQGCLPGCLPDSLQSWSCRSLCPCVCLQKLQNLHWCQVGSREQLPNLLWNVFSFCWITLVKGLQQCSHNWIRGLCLLYISADRPKLQAGPSVTILHTHSDWPIYSRPL